MISVEQLSKAIHEAPSGSKPGLSNWTYEHLKAVLSNGSKRKLQCLIDFADFILNNDKIHFLAKNSYVLVFYLEQKRKKVEPDQLDFWTLFEDG